MVRSLLLGPQLTASSPSKPQGITTCQGRTPYASGGIVTRMVSTGARSDCQCKVPKPQLADIRVANRTVEIAMVAVIGSLRMTCRFPKLSRLHNMSGPHLRHRERKLSPPTMRSCGHSVAVNTLNITALKPSSRSIEKKAPSHRCLHSPGRPTAWGSAPRPLQSATCRCTSRGAVLRRQSTERHTCPSHTPKHPHLKGLCSNLDVDHDT